MEIDVQVQEDHIIVKPVGRIDSAVVEEFQQRLLGVIQVHSAPVDEVLTNICAYAYPKGRGNVEVQCTHDAGPRLYIDIVDSGVPFDPLSAPLPDLLADPEERITGGLGIFLLRSIVDEMMYRRDHDQNILRLVIAPRP